MDLKALGVVSFVAAVYTAWPYLGKALKVSGGSLAVVVVIMTLVVVLITSHKEISQLRSIPVNALVWMFVFSTANGVAVYLYAVEAANPKVSTGMFLVSITVLQVFFAPFADWLVTRSIPTWQQFAGIGLIVPGIYLIANYGRQ